MNGEEKRRDVTPDAAGRPLPYSFLRAPARLQEEKGNLKGARNDANIGSQLTFLDSHMFENDLPPTPFKG